MSEGTRRFDTEAAQEFIDFLQGEIDAIEQTVTRRYFRGNGVLGRMPAFGFGGDSASLESKYTTFHTGVWSDLQGVIASYKGFIEALEAVIETNEEAEAVTSAELDGQMGS